MAEQVRRRATEGQRLLEQMSAAQLAREPKGPLSAKMYPAARLLPDVSRGAVSPLGGLAVSATKGAKR